MSEKIREAVVRSSPADGMSGSSTSENHPNGRWLLVTDVDDTLLGDDAAFAEFVALTAPIEPLLIIWNSARPIRSLKQTIEQLNTDWRPFGLIGALGTEIELDGMQLRSWQHRFRGFDRKPIDTAMAGLGCEPHDEEFQTAFKASFAVPPELQVTATNLIHEIGMPVMIIRSGETNFDVIPEKAGKGAAFQHVSRVLGVPPERTRVAGDSRNDFDMLLSSTGIVVGNATQQLKERLRHVDHDLYFAERTHAAGLLEGLRHTEVPFLSLDQTPKAPAED